MSQQVEQDYRMHRVLGNLSRLDVDRLDDADRGRVETARDLLIAITATRVRDGAEGSLFKRSSCRYGLSRWNRLAIITMSLSPRRPFEPDNILAALAPMPDVRDLVNRLTAFRGTRPAKAISAAVLLGLGLYNLVVRPGASTLWIGMPFTLLGGLMAYRALVG